MRYERGRVAKENIEKKKKKKKKEEQEKKKGKIKLL